MSKENMQMSDAMKEKMASMSPEQQEEMKKKMAALTPEQRQQMMQQMQGMSPEQRAEMEKKRASMTPEQLAELSKNEEKQRQMKEKMQQMQASGGGGGMGGGKGKGAKAKDFKGTSSRLVAYIGNQKYKAMVVILCAIIATVCAVLAPYILSNLLDSIQARVGALQEIRWKRVIVFTVTLGVLYLINALLSLAQGRMMTDVTQKTLCQMRKDVDQKLMRLPFSYFDSNPKGDILSRLTNDIDNVGTSLQQTITQIITSLITVVGCLAFMFSISWSLTLLCLLSIPLSIFSAKKIMGKSQQYFKDQWKSTGSLNSVVEETYSGMNVVKAFGLADVKAAEFEVENENLYAVSQKAQFLSAIINPVSNLFNNLAYILICGVGAYRLMNGTITFGNISAMIQYQRQYSNPITQITSMLNTLQSAVASAERVFELLDEKEEVETSEHYQKLVDVKGDVRFEHLQFGYTPDKLLMKDIDIEVKAGQMVAIVGPTGAGKTTLVNLLMRFYEPNGGKITIDGMDVRDMTRHDLRTVFGMVLQDTWLFNGSIRENVAYGKENATEQDLAEVAEAAQIEFFFKTMADGYDTVITEDAGNISQGQKQLLTIARAMIADPPILILDEATSSVDTKTEALIQKAMENLLKGRTSFVIAHRLSTIKNADLILVMKDGNIIEQGTHESLMQDSGLYAELYESQFSHEEDAEEEDENSLELFSFTTMKEDVWQILWNKYREDTGMVVHHRHAQNMEYEKNLFAALKSDNPPVLFRTRQRFLREIPALQACCEPLNDTVAAKSILNEKYQVKKGDDVLGTLTDAEALGIVYNTDITKKYFSLADKAVSINDMQEIKSFEMLKAVVEDMSKHKEELGIKGVFPTCAFAPNEEIQWKTHIMALPVYYEYKDKGITTTDDFEFKYQENLKNLFDLYFNNCVGGASDFETMTMDDSIAQMARGEAAMIQHFDWIYKRKFQRMEGNIITEEMLDMIPAYFGTKDEATQSLCIGHVWLYCVNRNVSPEEKKKAKDLLDWMYTSEKGKKQLQKMNCILPYKTVTREDVPQLPLALRAYDMMCDPAKDDNYLAYIDVPVEDIGSGFAANVLKYAKGEKPWDEVVAEFKAAWKPGKESMRARLNAKGEALR